MDALVVAELSNRCNLKVLPHCIKFFLFTLSAGRCDDIHEVNIADAKRRDAPWVVKSDACLALMEEGAQRI